MIRGGDRGSSILLSLAAVATMTVGGGLGFDGTVSNGFADRFNPVVAFANGAPEGTFSLSNPDGSTAVIYRSSPHAVSRALQQTVDETPVRPIFSGSMVDHAKQDIDQEGADPSEIIEDLQGDLKDRRTAESNIGGLLLLLGALTAYGELGYTLGDDMARERAIFDSLKQQRPSQG